MKRYFYILLLASLLTLNTVSSLGFYEDHSTVESCEAISSSYVMAKYSNITHEIVDTFDEDGHRVSSIPTTTFGHTYSPASTINSIATVNGITVGLNDLSLFDWNNGIWHPVEPDANESLSKDPDFMNYETRVRVKSWIVVRSTQGIQHRFELSPKKYELCLSLLNSTVKTATWYGFVTAKQVNI